MNTSQVKKSRAMHWFVNAIVYLTLGYSTLVLFGKFPNPVDRYFEISPGSYRALSDADNLSLEQERSRLLSLAHVTNE